MRTIAVANEKGGVGKTTIAINLSATLANQGQRVLTIDMDPQGHCAVGVAVDDVATGLSIFDCLSSQQAQGRCIDLSHITWKIAPNFDMAPSGPALAQLETGQQAGDQSATLLRRAIVSVRHRYDFCIIDCPPYMGTLMRNALIAADEVMIPVETAYFSVHDLDQRIESLRGAANGSGSKVIVRVVPNQYDVRTKLAREILAELRRKFKAVVSRTVINFNTKLKESASYGQPITEYAPGSAGARDFQSLAQELLADPETPIHRHEAVVAFADKLARDANRLLATARPLLSTERAADIGSAESKRPVPDRAIAEKQDAAGTDTDSGAAEPERSVHQRIDDQLAEIYGVRQTPEAVIFRTQRPGARVVQLAGDFNDWMPQRTPLQRLEDSDVFETSLQLRAGRYRYRLVVDGRWAHDRDNPQVEPDGHGEVNSVVEVK